MKLMPVEMRTAEAIEKRYAHLRRTALIMESKGEIDSAIDTAERALTLVRKSCLASRRKIRSIARFTARLYDSAEPNFYNIPRALKILDESGLEKIPSSARTEQDNKLIARLHIKFNIITGPQINFTDLSRSDESAVGLTENNV